jgi:predicted CXXCH cytochrome family protein
MASNRLKVVILTAFSCVVLVWIISGTFSRAHGEPIAVEPEAEATPITAPKGNPADYVGSETCAACHDKQAKDFSATKHAKLKDLESWKNKVQGCESCHGPGKAHSEEGDPTKIISFKRLSSKQASDSCLTCHAGKEGHNNFRRGEHWKNNVGCTDCHSPHGSPFEHNKVGSATLIAQSSRQNPGVAASAMLRQSEPQLCMGCHTETKAQFSKPFHHKVLEGAMSCSSCHNPHGGFETKQTKASVGADASCIRCHTEKQGPFVFEHAPLRTEGCSACHTPHGSANPKLLTRSTVRQTCLECHSSIGDEITPGVPSFHNQATVRYRECTVCHVQIHGSNAHKAFFR